jgi:hypothetical protein
MTRLPGRRYLLMVGTCVAVAIVLGACVRHFATQPRQVPRPRVLPQRFPPNTHLPPVRETIASGPVDPKTFTTGDLVRVKDPRVWWESDQDPASPEDDHLVYRSLEPPLRKVIELVCRRGGQLQVRDAYRPSGTHLPSSLHREGRAVDLTCTELSIEELARLCWLAGFDWVFHEKPAGGAGHVHASVRR